jgi:hypothetical protein
MVERGDRTSLWVRERITVRKFEGAPPREGERGEPLEVIVIEDGRVVETVWIRQRRLDPATGPSSW